ncbi:hypothetical protein RAA17_18515 [Komagataeibacter rhaeticus]|nr:hypothetical protein [Komagataeibacter rhaeticus]
MAALVPLTYDGHAGRWTWLFRGSGLPALYRARDGHVPAGRRRGCGGAALRGPVHRRACGQCAGARGLPAYACAAAGGGGGYSRSGSWDEVHGMLMLHYAPG